MSEIECSALNHACLEWHIANPATLAVKVAI